MTTKVGEFCGLPIHIDASMRPGEIKIVSATWDNLERRMRVLDECRIINLGDDPLPDNQS